MMRSTVNARGRIVLTASQLAVRQSGIGASEAAAVLGVSPYRTPLDVWRAKTAPPEVQDAAPSEAAHFGHLLEDVVAREYARRMDVRVRRSNRTWRHPEHHWMLAHLDRRVEGAGILECKTAGAWRGSEWADSGTVIERAEDGGIPDEYYVQVQHQLAVTELGEADVAVLIGGQDFRIYHLRRDPQFIGALIEIERDFWSHVERRSAPAPTTWQDLTSLYPRDDGTAVEADSDDIERIRYLLTLRERMREDRATEDAIKLELARKLGAGDSLVYDGRVLVTRRTQERQAYTVAASTSRPLRIRAKALPQSQWGDPS